MLPEKIPQLDVSIADQPGMGQLLKASTYEFRYLKADQEQLSVALLMPAARQRVFVPACGQPGWH